MLQEPIDDLGLLRQSVLVPARGEVNRRETQIADHERALHASRERVAHLEEDDTGRSGGNSKSVSGQSEEVERWTYPSEYMSALSL